MFLVFIFLVLLGTGVGIIPVPEDIIVLSAGVGVFENEGSLAGTLFIVLLGIIISDIIIFFVGRKFGDKIFKIKFFSFFINREKMEKVQKMLDGHAGKIIFGGRFVSGFRPIIFLSAGICKIPFSVFFISDFLASILYAPLMIFLGYRFSYDIDKISSGMTKFYHFIEVAIITFIVVWVIFKLSKRIFNINNGVNNCVDKKEKNS